LFGTLKLFPALVEINSRSTSDNLTFFESRMLMQLKITSLKTFVPIEKTFPLGPTAEKYLYASLLYLGFNIND
jgi:hypothetical protein